MNRSDIGSNNFGGRKGVTHLDSPDAGSGTDIEDALDFWAEGGEIEVGGEKEGGVVVEVGVRFGFVVAAGWGVLAGV